jgi:hypothetical protein
MSAAQRAVEAIREALDGRQLIWHGIRGEDGEALLALDELAAAYSIIAPMRTVRIAEASNVSFELISGRRPDLDSPELDVDKGPAAREYRRRLLQEVSRSCVVMTYRPTALVSALAFSMRDTMTLAGLLLDRQRPFEHKPWVEQSLDVRGLGWQYVADEHRSRAKRLVAEGPQILRASRTSGGEGVVLARSGADVDEHWPDQPDEFVAVAPFLDPALPVNVSGCLFADGSIRVHPPSVQLIGISSCTRRTFGFCGSDFAAASHLDGDVLDQLQALVLGVGSWLRDEHYLGAFGVDVLVHDGQVHFTEINARFQGSSAPSASIADGLDVPSLFLDHLAAFLGLPPASDGLTAGEWAAQQRPLSQIVVHNTQRCQVARDRGVEFPERPPGVSYGQLPEQVAIDPGAALCRISMPRSVTADGFHIDDDATALIDSVRRCFTAVS